MPFWMFPPPLVIALCAVAQESTDRANDMAHRLGLNVPTVLRGVRCLARHTTAEWESCFTIYERRVHKAREMRRLYVLFDEAKAIQCLRCGMLSYNMNDFAELYCAECRVFLLDQQIAEEIADRLGI